MALIGGCGAHVVENFAARTAGTGVAHGPEIFFQAGDGNDAVFWRADFGPEGGGFRVVGERDAGNFRAAENGEVELFERDANQSGEVINSIA